MNSLLLATLCIAGTFAAEKLVKNQTAGGYHSDAPAYGGYGGYGGYAIPPPIQDRNVCDLDASVLLVVGSGRHGYNKAVRVRCSEIANYDADSCNVCCQQAARRDRNLQNQDMFGFLSVSDDEHHEKDGDNEESEEDGEYKRMKRGSGYNDHVEVTKLNEESWKADPQFKNVKCVCCAPKRALPPPTPTYYPQQPVYPTYTAAAQPQYPAQAPAAAPAYQAPAAAPAYQAHDAPAPVSY